MLVLESLLLLIFISLQDQLSTSFKIMLIWWKHTPAQNGRREKKTARTTKSTRYFYKWWIRIMCPGRICKGNQKFTINFWLIQQKRLLRILEHPVDTSMTRVKVIRQLMITMKNVKSSTTISCFCFKIEVLK